MNEHHSTAPVRDRRTTRRRRLGLKGELVLVLLPTLTILVVLALVEALSQQQLLLASLAASAFLIYLDPEHATNSMRTLLLAQPGAALVGWAGYLLLGPGYLSAALAMIITIVLMVAFDLVHPPAVATAMSFALRSGKSSNLAVFGLAVLITAVLVALERSALWLLARHEGASK